MMTCFRNKRKKLLRKAPVRQHFGSVQKWKRLRRIGEEKHELKRARRPKANKKRKQKSTNDGKEQLDDVKPSETAAEKKTNKRKAELTRAADEKRKQTTYVSAS